jgi:hypothetical protein
MYVPPLDSILRMLNSNRDALDGNHAIKVPASLLRLLLKMSVAGSDINEAGYLSSNPDISAAFAEGKIASPEDHYAAFGFFEGRLGATPNVDEDWYLKSYPDVAEAVKLGKVKSASEHFALIGAAEGRSPTAKYESQAAQWRRAFNSVITK